MSFKEQRKPGTGQSLERVLSGELDAENVDWWPSNKKMENQGKEISQVHPVDNNDILIQNKKGQKPGSKKQANDDLEYNTHRPLTEADDKRQPKIEEKKKEGSQPTQMIPFMYFFRYMTRNDKILLTIGAIACVIAGCLVPSLALIMGQITQNFDPRNSKDQMLDAMKTLAGQISLVGLGLWVAAYLYYGFWQHLAENITFDLRSRYLHSILKQEIAYFETQNVEQLPSQIGENFALIQDAVGEKFSSIIFTMFTITAGFGIALYKGVDFTFICLAYFPIVVILSGIFGKKVRTTAIQKMQVTKRMGGVVEESLSAIRLITSFAEEDKEIRKFEKQAMEVKEIAHTSEVWLSTMIGIFRFTIIGFYVYSFWIATHYIEKKYTNPNTGAQYDVNDLLCILMAMMTGMINLFGLNPNFEAIVKAKVAGSMIFEVMDREPKIRDLPNCVENFTLDRAIRFENVTFKYPLAPVHVKNVLEGAHFSIKAGQSTAIVGPSGSGKSTIIQMIERFYDPLGGDIFFDQTNLKSLKLKSLRESIGYVSQEPVLILGTIRDNLLFGNKDATQEDIDYALKQANAQFVYEMENGLDTFCGSSAVLNLSGGQKQRIAIARALIKRPKILILDEATSALDPKSEREVQGAIDKISQEQANYLTIIMIAHRLQTIMTAQNLLYLESKSSLVPAAKGTSEYDEIIRRLEETNYAHQKDDKPEANKEAIKKDKSAANGVADAHDSEDEAAQAEEAKEEAAQETKNQSQNELERKDKKEVSMGKIMSYYHPQWLAYVCYIITIINAFSYPLMGLIFAKVLFVMMDPTSKTFNSDRNFWMGMFLLLAGCMGIVGFFNKYIYAFLGENLTYTVRNKLFTSIVYKHLAWFDNKDRAPGILSNTLSEDITLLNGLASETISNIMEGVLCIVVGVIFSFIFTWHMALISLGAIPFLMAGGVIMAKLRFNVQKTQGQVREKGEQDPYEQANALLSDMLINYRTVISFGEKNVLYVMGRFDKLLEEPNRLGVINAHKAGFWFGYSQCIRFFFLAFVFYIGSIFIFDHGDQPSDTYIGLFILFISAMGSGISISRAPSVSKARNAAKKVFDIIEDVSKIDTRSTEGIKEIKEGKIELKNVYFKYPSRIKNVLNSLNMTIPATKKIALVGHSGCGKSTIANLLLRMYDVTGGHFLIDGEDIRKYNVKQLRKQIGIVMQEPILFNMSIKDNILYGNDKATDQRVREVAQMANALAFIESNIEDLDQEEVQQKFESTFREFINKPEISKTYPNFQVLLMKYFNEKAFTITELQLILEILEKGDNKLRTALNNFIMRFCDLVKEVSERKGIKWDDIVLLFEWSFESDRIVEFLKSDEATHFKSSHKEAVHQAFKTQATKFDLLTIREYSKQLQFLEKPEGSEVLLKTIINQSFERLKQKNNARIHELHHSNTSNQDFKLHEGFNKNCGLKGSLLSGGQKQRIAIARALIKDPKILILDEATSALDEQSQELVQQALDRAMEGRTSVVIAHRLSTIRNCEWLFVIHNGVVVEQGTYDELSADPNSYFFKLKSGMEM